MSESTLEREALSMVAPSMRSSMQEYSDLLTGLAGDTLLGLTVFGAVLGEHFDSSRMAAAGVMVLEHVDLSLLRRVAEYGPKLGSKHISAPLVMTPAYITSSLDSFPLEMLEIHQHRLTLVGRDFFESLNIEAEHLRLQCEREFKRILIRLRQGLLAAGSREDVLGELAFDIGQHLLRTLRGLLWLKGRTEPLPRDQVLAESEKMVDGSLIGVRSALELQGAHDWESFQSLYTDVEKLATLADTL